MLLELGELLAEEVALVFHLLRGGGGGVGGSRVSGFGFRVSGFGFRVSGFGFRVSGLGFRV